jgi:hypothetical protein
MKKELDYKDVERGRVILGVLQYLLRELKPVEGDELQELKNWAVRSTLDDLGKVKVRGFGPAGFQYLRMIYGAQTAKPDIYLKRFVARCIGRPVDEWEAVNLLEKASEREGIRLRDFENAVWERYSSEHA